MRLTLEEMRDIAKRLPIGFYLGRKTPVFVEESGGAYCDVVKGDIHIGMPLLQTVADKIDASDAAKWDREKLLRCLLYHEIGHLLLTPSWLKGVVHNGWDSDVDYGTRRNIVNIFEDERLECVLSQVFMGVEFKPFVRLVHKGVKVDPGSLESRFLHGVRLRETTQEISDAIDDAIDKTAFINCTTPPYRPGNAYDIYWTELAKLVKLFAQPSEQEEQQQQNQQQGQGQQQSQQSQGQSEDDGEKPDGSGGNQDEDDGKDGDGEDEDKDKERNDEGSGDADGEGGEDESDDKGEDEDGDKSGGDSGEDDEDEEPEDDSDPDADGEDDGANDGASEDETDDDSDERPPSEEAEKGDPAHGRTPRTVKLPAGFLQATAKKVFVEPTDEIANKLQQFASRLAKKRGAQSAGCWSALHGKIDTRRDAQDKDRIFRRRSDVGDRLMSSVNLTLWVDNSGSFIASGPVLNKILAAVARAVGMSQGKLAANVVKMGEYAELAPQTHWFVEPCEDNDINPTYTLRWRETRSKTRRNIDIVVFDGQATYFRPDKIAIAKQIWDSPDCHVISDPDNEPMFKLMKKAHVTYVSSDYAEHLQEEVMKTLDRIL